MKEEIAGNDEILKIVNKKEEEDRTVKILRKDYPDKTNELEEALLDYMGENDFKILKTVFSDKFN